MPKSDPVGAGPGDGLDRQLQEALDECQEWCESSEVNAVELVCEFVMPALEAALAALRGAAPVPAPQEWQPIETAPKDGIYIVANKYGVWVTHQYASRPENATHWMPLPDPPAALVPPQEPTDGQ
jgi:uncharacterized protein DUF551